MRRKYTGSKRPAAVPVEDDAPTPPEDRSEHLVSLTRLAAMIGRDRGTISDWVRKGMPVAKRAGAGETMLLDPKEVFAWRENFCREEEIARAGKPTRADSGPTFLSRTVPTGGRRRQTSTPRYWRQPRRHSPPASPLSWESESSVHLERSAIPPWQPPPLS